MSSNKSNINNDKELQFDFEGPSENEIQIFIVGLDNEKFFKTFDINTKIKDIKRVIKTLTGIRHKDQRLLHNGRQLSVLKDKKIQKSPIRKVYLNESETGTENYKIEIDTQCNQSIYTTLQDYNIRHCDTICLLTRLCGD